MNSIRTRRERARLGGRSDGVQYDNVIQSNTKVLMYLVLPNRCQLYSREERLHFLISILR